MTESIFEKGVLIDFHITMFNPYKKIDKNREALVVSSALTEDQRKCHRIKQEIIDAKRLQEISAVRSAASAYIRSVALPFSLAGVWFIPNGLIENVHNMLETYKANFFKAVEAFVALYPSLKEKAQMQLGDLIHEKYYPKDGAELREYFSFSWSFEILSVPKKDQFAGIPAAVFSNVQKQFEQKMQETEELARQALRIEFQALVDHAVDRLTPAADGTSKIFRNSLIGNFQEFFGTFTKRNCFGDEELAKLVEEANKVLTGIDPETLREDKDIRDKMHEKLSGIKNVIDKSLIDTPARKVLID